MENWRKAWRRGLAPLLPTKGLEALAKALAEDDPRLLQGATTDPPPLECVQDMKVAAACAVGFCGWQGQGLETVIEVSEFFANTTFASTQTLGSCAETCQFLNWFDETPRAEMRRELLPEVWETLARRRAADIVA